MGATTERLLYFVKWKMTRICALTYIRMHVNIIIIVHDFLCYLRWQKRGLQVPLYFTANIHVQLFDID